MLKPLDVIELRTVVAGWEAGTIATVLECRPDSVLAEVADDDGRTLDVVTVPTDAALLVADDDVPERPKASPKRPGSNRSREPASRLTRIPGQELARRAWVGPTARLVRSGTSWDVSGPSAPGA